MEVKVRPRVARLRGARPLRRPRHRHPARTGPLRGSVAFRSEPSQGAVLKFCLRVGREPAHTRPSKQNFRYWEITKFRTEKLTNNVDNDSTSHLQECRED